MVTLRVICLRAFSFSWSASASLALTLSGGAGGRGSLCREPFCGSASPQSSGFSEYQCLSGRWFYFPFPTPIRLQQPVPLVPGPLGVDPPGLNGWSTVFFPFLKVTSLCRPDWVSALHPCWTLAFCPSRIIFFLLPLGDRPCPFRGEAHHVLFSEKSSSFSFHFPGPHRCTCSFLPSFFGAFWGVEAACLSDRDGHALRRAAPNVFGSRPSLPAPAFSYFFFGQSGRDFSL